MAAHKDITSKAIVGNCLLNELKKGRISYNKRRFIMPYILYELINTTCTDITNNQLLVSRYNDLIRTCKYSAPSATVAIPDSIITESGDYLLTESGDYLLIE